MLVTFGTNFPTFRNFVCTDYEVQDVKSIDKPTD